MSNLCIAIPKRRPSETGLSSLELTKYIGTLKSREAAISKIKEFLAEIEKADNPICGFIVAEWGEGKTSLYYVYLDTLRPPKAVSFIISTRTVVEYLRDALRGKLFGSTKSYAYLVLASILAALVEEQIEAIEMKCGSRIKVAKPYEYDDAKKYIVDVLNEILNSVCRADKLVVFVDEFEDLVTIGDAQLVDAMVTGITHILNGVVSEISSRSEGIRGPYAGRVHLLFSLTPSAYAKLKSFGDISTVIARLSRRIKEIELRALPREEAYVFISGLLKYLYDDDIPLNKVFQPPSLVNTLIVSTLGNVAALQKALVELLYLNSVRAICENGMKILTPEAMIEHLKDIKVHVAGADLPLLVETNLNKIESLWERYIVLEERIDKGNAVAFLRYTLTAFLFTEDEVVKYINVKPNDVKNLVFTINVFARSPQLGLGLKRFVYRARAYSYSTELKSLIEDTWIKALQTIPTLSSEARELARLLTEQMIFVDSDGQLVIAIPETRDLSELKDFALDIIPSMLSDVEAEKLASSLAISLSEALNSGSFVDKGSRYLVSPKVISIVYLSPELTFLDFIKDIDKRFRYWRELLAETQSEFLLLGVLALLNSKPSKIVIEDIEVI